MFIVLLFVCFCFFSLGFFPIFSTLDLFPEFGKFHNIIYNRVMLSCESNENGEKTTIGQKGNFARAAHFSCTFRCRCTWNFQKLPGYTFYGGNVVRVLVHFSCFCFSLPHIFMSPLSFFYFALAVCRSFSRWASLFCRLLSLFLCIQNLWTWQFI